MQTDLSALPPPRRPTHASFGRNETRYFDKTAAPDEVKEVRRGGGTTLNVPSYSNNSRRPRASSLDGATKERYQRPTAEALRNLSYMNNSDEEDPSDSDEDEGELSCGLYISERGLSIVDFFSSSDKFTAVGTGVQTDVSIDEEEDVAAINFASVASYGRTPNGNNQRTTISSLNAYGSRNQLQAKLDSRGKLDIRGNSTKGQINLANYYEDDDDEEPAPRYVAPAPAPLPSSRSRNLAPPTSIIRPSSAGSNVVRQRGGIQDLVENLGRAELGRLEHRAAPAIKARVARVEGQVVSSKAGREAVKVTAAVEKEVQEDTAAEKNLIRLLKDMVCSRALFVFWLTPI